MQDLAVFISYRRSDTSADAGRLYDALRRRFGRDSLFMDVDNLRPGQDWLNAIDEAVANSDVFIAVIGVEWQEARDQQGQRRLDNELDPVRLEIEAAIRQDKPIIPVLFGAAVMPRADQLPTSLVPLIRRHAIQISHPSFDADMQPLFRALRSIEKAKAAAIGATVMAATPRASRPSAVTAKVNPTTSSQAAHLSGGGRRLWPVVAVAGALVAIAVLVGGKLGLDLLNAIFAAASPSPTPTAIAPATSSVTPLPSALATSPGVTVSGAIPATQTMPATPTPTNLLATPAATDSPVVTASEHATPSPTPRPTKTLRPTAPPTDPPTPGPPTPSPTPPPTPAPTPPCTVNADANGFVIGTTGDDVLCGNSGPNYFYTKGGHDVVRGLGGTDSLDFEGYAAVTIDMPIGRATGSWGRVDFSSIEDFYGTPFADTYNGYSGPDHFYGKSGNDKAYGKGGDDRLHGDAGDDYLDGGTGANYLDGGADTDTCLNGATLVACEATATTTSAWAIQRTTPGAAWAAGDRRRRLLRVE